MKKTITQITVDRKGLVRKTLADGSWTLVSGYTPIPFLKVGELYIETTPSGYGGNNYGVSSEPFGNCTNYPATSPYVVAERVIADYDAVLANAIKLALPISQSYIDRFGTGME
tara:strand:+ start:3133 stop:3471 length:339 start_codon:yes stop_codon:yes gene_type:complete